MTLGQGFTMILVFPHIFIWLILFIFSYSFFLHYMSFVYILSFPVKFFNGISDYLTTQSLRLYLFNLAFPELFDFCSFVLSYYNDSFGFISLYYYIISYLVIHIKFIIAYYYIIFYHYPLEICLISNERLQVGEFGCERRWEETE